MKRIRFISALLSAAVMLCAFSACNGKTVKESESETYHFDSPNKAFEAMTDAFENGQYSDALNIYKSGAADADNPELINQYYFVSLAAANHTDKGCIGVPIDILINRTAYNFDPAQKLQAELYLQSRIFNGAFADKDNYIYFADGKIAASIGTQLTGDIICADELAKIDDHYFWVRHNQNGPDTVLYKLEFTDNMLIVTADESNQNDMFSGEYAPVSAELPALYY